MKAYEVKMVFKADVSVPELNEVFDKYGEPRVCAKEALDVVLTRTVPEIPEQDTLDKMAEAIKNGFNELDEKAFYYERVRFSHFENIKEIEL